MLWKTHIRIAYKILSKLGLPNSTSEANQLREGSIAPDKWKDYPHHHGKSESIRTHILVARKFFLSNDLSKAYFHLGVALHYIQDSFTSLSPFKDEQILWENEIQQANVVENLEDLVNSTFQDDQYGIEKYVKVIKKLESEIEGKEQTLQIATLPSQTEHAYWGASLEGFPSFDLNFAYRVSLLVSKSVLGSKTNFKLQEKLQNVLKYYQDKLKKSELIVVEEIVELVNKKSELDKRQTRKGIYKILDTVLLLRTWISNLQLKRKFRDYENQRHLEKVADEYISKIKKEVSAYREWYNIFIPQIELNVVESELLSVFEAGEKIGIPETDIEEFIEKNNITSYMIQDRKIIRKKEIENYCVSR